MRATLLTDGSSDAVLLPVLRWLLGRTTRPGVEWVIEWADLRWLRRPPRKLSGRIAAALQLVPCDLLFVHRDAEAQDPDLRYREIATSVYGVPPHVAVVPVRMQEAWLLFDEAAIRLAAGRPSGRDALRLPPWREVERLADPKARLHEALRIASAATGRRRRKLNVGKAVHRLADLIEDWSPLLRLSAFQRLESDLRRALTRLGVGDE